MLNDFERKLLQILFNYSSMRHSMPNLKQLERMTGRTALEIERGLEVLIEQHYILWLDRQYTNSILLLKGWGQEQNGKTRSKQINRRVDYWTNIENLVIVRSLYC